MRGPTSRTVRERALSQARGQWESGYPHRALLILADAGMRSHWPTFVRVAHRHARARYLRQVTRR